jgi:hypothetical protein
MKDEYFGLIAPKNTVRNSFPLYDTFSRQYPFYYQQHLDPTGTLFGFTETNGCVVLNTFTRNTKRPSFDMVAIGVKGGGKSVTLKTMLEDQLLLGNKVMLIDIESEYGNLAAIYDGQIIAMTKDSAINPLQLMNSVNAGAESGGSLTMSVEEARSTNFTSEISRIITFMHQVHPTITEDEEVKFSDILADVYSKKGITKTTDLSTLSAYDFPIFSDLLTVCEEKIETADTKYEKEACQRLRSILKRLSKGGAYDIFDNYTNVNISDSSLVIFDVKALSEMDEKIYNAQLFNILSLMWGEVCKNVAVNQNIVNPFDRRNVVCLIDEAHRFISENNPQCTEFIEKLTRRSRKYFAGLWFATQSILDFLPNGLSSTSTVASKIKVIFQLVQYKVILKQDSSSVPALKEAFPQFTTSELRSATEFEPGEMLLALDSARLKIHCSRRATPANLMYMGNSHDVSDIINKIFDEKFILNNPDNMRKSDYGLQLCDKEKYENFISAFFDYVMEVLEIPSGASKYFDETVHKAVVELAKSLINEVEA